MFKLRMFNKNKNNQNGSILFAFMIAIAMSASAVAMYFHTIGKAAANDIAKQKLLQLIEAKKTIIQETLTSGSSWEYTLSAQTADTSYGVTDNSVLVNCLNNPNHDCSTTPFPILLADSSGVILDYISAAGLGINGTRGFNRNGDSCNNFPSSACPFRYTVLVTADCSNVGLSLTTCHQPFRLSISANLELSSSVSDNFLINESKHSVIVDK